MDTTSLRTVRHSTKAKTINADVARNVKEEHEKLRAKPSQRRVRAQFKQKELLEESLATEVSNLQHNHAHRSLQLTNVDSLIVGVQPEVAGHAKTGGGRAVAGRQAGETGLQ